MVAFQIINSKRALEYIEALPPKSQRIVIERCKTLAEDPFPGQGDREQIKRKGRKDIYRLRISRSYTAFYKIHIEERVVKILEIMTIEQAHKIYGRF